MLSKIIIKPFQLAYIILYFKFCERSKLDVSLHFHGEDQFLYHVGRMRSKLYRGEQVKYQVIFTDTTFLERDVPRGKQDLERMKNSKTCSKDSYDSCIYNMAKRLMLENTNDNCTAPWVPNAPNICTDANDISTCYWIWKNRVQYDAGDCILPCHSVFVQLDAKDTHIINDGKEYALLYLYFPSKLAKSKEHFLYHSNNLFAEIGGYVGLLLGLSLLDLFIWVNNIVTYRCTG